MSVSAVNAIPDTAQGLIDTAGIAIPGLRGVKVPRIPDISGEAGGMAAGIGSSVGHLGVLAGTAGVAGVPAAASLAGLETFGAHYHTLKAQGASETGALVGALGQSGVDAASIYVPLGKMAKFDGDLGKAITNGYVFGGMAGAQQVVTDAITKTATPQDMGTWLDWADRAGTAATQGGLTGLLVGAIHSAFAGMKPKVQQKILTNRAPAEEPVSVLGEAAKGAEPPVDAATIQDHPTPSETVQTPSTNVPRGTVESEAPPEEPLASPAEEAPTPSAGGKPAVSGETGAASGNGKGAAPVREPTGAKNETVDAELAAMGYEPGRHGDPSSFPEQWAKAKEIAAKDAFAGTKLVDDLADKTRPPTKLEVALLTHELNRRINERDVAEEAVRADLSEENIARRERAQNDYAKAADVSTRAGTESSGSLGFRRMMANRDFSLAATERKLEIAKGEKLTEAQAKTNADRSARIAKLEQAVAAIEDREALKQEVRARKPKGARAIADLLKPRAEIALKELAESFSIARSGPALSARDLKNVGIVGAHFIAEGAATVEAFGAKMVEALGEKIRPHLDEAYAQAQEIYTGSSKEQSRLKGAKTRTRKQIETVEGKTAANDFSKPERKPIAPDSELSGLRAQLEGAKREFKRTEFQFQREHRTNTRKAIDAAIEAKNFVGHWKTSFDMSAVLNQGAMHTIAHPIESARNVRMAARAAVSEPFYDRVNAALHAREHYQLGKKAGLALTAVGDDFSLREEQMRSRIAEKIPGIKHSARAFSTYLNLQRSQFFDAIVDGSPTKVTPELARDIADGVNTVTGRGNIRGFEKSIEAAGQVLWAPRLYISQFQRVAGAPMYRGNAYTRKAFAGEYARFLVGSAAIYGLAALIPGSTVETDTRSSDFGKIKIGDSRLDPTGGLVQTATLVGREALGQTKTLDKGQVKDTNRLDVAMRFLRMKLAPIPGAVADILDKKNAIGEPVTPLSVAKDQFVPLLGRDIYEAMLAQGVPKGAALSLLSFFGMRLSTFDAHAKKAKK